MEHYYEMSKVALCLSGHFRSFDRAFNSILNSIIRPYSPDIFIYAPATVGNDGADRGDKHLIRTQISEAKVRQLYQPKSLIIEPARTWDMSKYSSRVGSGCRNPNMIKGMYYGIYTANDLKRQYEQANGFIYDVVIRCRADLFFESNLDRAELENKSCIHIPKFGNYDGLNDQFALGSSAHMDMYSDTFNQLDKLFDMGCLWHAETLLKVSMREANIPILRSNINYYILRADGRKFRLLHDPNHGDVL